MLLFYASLGAWAVTAGTYLGKPHGEGGLGFSEAQVGWIFSTFAIGGLIANPFVGVLVDRLFRAERVFGVASIIGGSFLVAARSWCQSCELSLQPDSDSAAIESAFRILFAIMLAYSVFLQIALPLCTVLSLRNLPDPTMQFSRTRMWGTIGWIAIGLLLPLLVAVRSADPFGLAGLIMIACGAYGLTLPTTRPKGTAKGLTEAFGVPALKMFRKRSFGVYLAVAFALAVLNQFYAVHGHRFLTERGWNHPEQWMTFGQIVEVGCMFAIPMLKPKESMKWLMLAGALGGALRGAALAWGSDWMVFAVGVPMHGWHFALYFIVAATYVDREAPGHLRGSAQAIGAFVNGGLGPLIGNRLAALVLESGRIDGQFDWTAFWLWPLVGCLLASLAFLIGFRTPPQLISVPSALVEPPHPGVEAFDDALLPMPKA